MGTDVCQVVWYAGCISFGMAEKLFMEFNVQTKGNNRNDVSKENE